jgi:hypothetical protein
MNLPHQEQMFQDKTYLSIINIKKWQDTVTGSLEIGRSHSGSISSFWESGNLFVWKSFRREVFSLEIYSLETFSPGNLEWIAGFQK